MRSKIDSVVMFPLPHEKRIVGSRLVSLGEEWTWYKLPIDDKKITLYNVTNLGRSDRVTIEIIIYFLRLAGHEI